MYSLTSFASSILLTLNPMGIMGITASRQLADYLLQICQEHDGADTLKFNSGQEQDILNLLNALWESSPLSVKQTVQKNIIGTKRNRLGRGSLSETKVVLSDAVQSQLALWTSNPEGALQPVAISRDLPNNYAVSLCQHLRGLSDTNAVLKVQRRLACVALWQLREETNGDDMAIAQYFSHVQYSIEETDIRKWYNIGSRYNSIATDLGGYEALFVLPDDIPKTVWERALQKTGDDRADFIKRVLERIRDEMPKCREASHAILKYQLAAVKRWKYEHFLAWQKTVEQPLPQHQITKRRREDDNAAPALRTINLRSSRSPQHDDVHRPPTVLLAQGGKRKRHNLDSNTKRRKRTEATEPAAPPREMDSTSADCYQPCSPSAPIGTETSPQREEDQSRPCSQQVEQEAGGTQDIGATDGEFQAGSLLTEDVRTTDSKLAEDSTVATVDDISDGSVESQEMSSNDLGNSGRASSVLGNPGCAAETDAEGASDTPRSSNSEEDLPSLSTRSDGDGARSGLQTVQQPGASYFVDLTETMSRKTHISLAALQIAQGGGVMGGLQYLGAVPDEESQDRSYKGPTNEKVVQAGSDPFMGSVLDTDGADIGVYSSESL
ncbi:hypothetical protein PG987_003110 [Apiospora arundinis]|uniref:Uncharacterized protein n=1 Tax=Apiospora arundinis TaxID=335852 RepID=A0ABR2HZN3_9PEZI